MAAAAAGEKPLTWRQRRARFRQIWGLARRHGLLPFRKLDFSYDPATAEVLRWSRQRVLQHLREVCPDERIVDLRVSVRGPGRT